MQNVSNFFIKAECWFLNVFCVGGLFGFWLVVVFFLFVFLFFQVLFLLPPFLNNAVFSNGWLSINYPRGGCCSLSDRG